MAEIVAVMAATHGPGLTGWFDQGRDEDRDVVRKGYGELRRRLQEAQPDAMIMLGNDHLLNWPINNTPDYTIGIGAEHIGPADWYDAWLALPKYRVRGHPELARYIVRQMDLRGVKVSYLRQMEFDDNFSVPLAYLDPPATQTALLPVSMNCTVPPIPTAEASYRFGEALRQIILDWPRDEHIAIIATGGLSHEPGGPRYMLVDEAFDRWFLDLLAKGDHSDILEKVTLERMEAAGSGGTAELIAWMAALPFTEGPADILGYTPAIAWRTGVGMVAWPVR